MAQRAQQKPKRKPARKTSGDLGAAVERLEAETKSLRAERDAIAGELEEAKLRIAELEAAQAEAINRIDWVIDSLHTVIEDGK